MPQKGLFYIYYTCVLSDDFYTLVLSIFHVTWNCWWLLLSTSDQYLKWRQVKWKIRFRAIPACQCVVDTLQLFTCKKTRCWVEIWRNVAVAEKRWSGTGSEPLIKFYNMCADCVIVSCDSMFPGASDLFQLHVLNLASFAFIKNRVWCHYHGVIPAMGLVIKVLEPSVLKDTMPSSPSITIIIVQSTFNMYVIDLKSIEKKTYVPLD